MRPENDEINQRLEGIPAFGRTNTVIGDDDVKRQTMQQQPKLTTSIQLKLKKSNHQATL
jgi:hypothetical protein